MEGLFFFLRWETQHICMSMEMVLRKREGVTASEECLRECDSENKQRQKRGPMKRAGTLCCDAKES